MKAPRANSIQGMAAHLAAIIESSDDAIVSTDLSGNVNSWNRAAEKIFGYSTTEMLGRSIAIIMPADRGAEEREILGNVRQGQRIDQYQTVGKRKNGAAVDISLTVSPIKDPQHHVIGVSILARDMTHDREAQEATRRHPDQRVAERTHELIEARARLRILTSELSLAEQRVRRQIATELHDYLGQLLAVCRIKLSQAGRHDPQPDCAREIQAADKVLREALAYTRSLAAELSPPVLREFGLTMGLTWLAEQMEQHGVTVSMNPAIPDFDVTEDQAILLFQSVRELLMNVVKHAGTNRAALSVCVAEDGGVLIITVADAGRGFDHALERRTGSKHVGLFGIRERMEILGGRLELKTAPAQGTTASLILPVGPRGRRRESKLSPQPVYPAKAHPHSPVTVLMVDDHPLVREGLRGVLEGYDQLEIVAEATDGDEAVQLAAQLHPDVVIMDVNMPRLDGIEATRRIVQSCPSMAVIGLSVHQNHHIERSMREAGAVGYLTKDVAAERLYSAITSAVKNT